MSRDVFAATKPPLLAAAPRQLFVSLLPPVPRGVSRPFEINLGSIDAIGFVATKNLSTGLTTLFEALVSNTVMTLLIDVEMIMSAHLHHLLVEFPVLGLFSFRFGCDAVWSRLKNETSGR